MQTYTQNDYRGAVMERKRINISSKRQVTIPQKYFEMLGFEDEAECILRDGELILRPVRYDGGEFAEQILADLLQQGYAGEELLAKFKETQRQIRSAVERMMAEAAELAHNRHDTPPTLDELFGAEE